MAQLILSVAGASIPRIWKGITGNAISGAWGVTGAIVGGIAGMLIDRKFSKKDYQEGPRLNDLSVQISTYGTAIPKLWGGTRIAGNVIWAADTREVRKETEEGGCGPPTPVQVSYSYFQSFAVGLCEGPIQAVLRIWANGDLIFNAQTSNDKVVTIPGMNFRVYLGTETQLPSPVLEAIEGEGNVPAYRGLAYVVFDDLPLDKFGNAIPNLSFEVLSAVTESSSYVELDDINAGLFGTDNIVMCPDNIHFIIEQSGYWDKVNTLTNRVVAHSEFLRSGGVPEIPDTGDFDVDERRAIYTTKYSATASKSYLCKLGSSFITEGPTSIDEFDSPYRIRVFKTSIYPYVVVIASGGQSLYFTHRDLFSVGVTAKGTVSPPADVQFLGMSIDHDNGVVWTVCKHWLNSNAYTKVMKISPSPNGTSTTTTYDVSASIAQGNEILFDYDTNQILIGNTSTGKVCFFDADDMSLLGTIASEGVSAYAKSAWQRGAVNGTLIYTYSSNQINRIDLISRTIDKTWAIDPAPGNWNGGCMYDQLTHSVIAACLGSGFDFCKVLLDRGLSPGVPLYDIVSDICADVGLDESADLDVSELTDTVKGFVVNDRMSARDAIQPLMDSYFFDSVESDGEIKFPKRGSGFVVNIPETDLATHVYGDERPQELITTRMQELELPRRVEVIYCDAETNYEAGAQGSSRIITNSKEIITLQLPIALDKDEAKQIAEKHLAAAWAERTGHQFQIPRDYSYLDPADVVIINEGDFVHTVRIADIAFSGGMLAVTAANQDASAYVSDAEGVDMPGRDQDISYAGPTELVLVDGPLLQSTNNESGVYVAALGYLSQWSGAVIYKSNDGGNTWSQWTTCTKDAIVAVATDALGDVSDPFIWDNGNTVNVRMLDDGDTLSSATALEVLNGSNAGALVASTGDVEYINWTTATLETDGSYTLSGLLRGRKGSDAATGLHAASDLLVLLSSTYLHFTPFAVEDKALERSYKAVTFGTRFIDGLDQDFTCNIRNMTPLSVQHISGSRDGSGNLTITWLRRTRIAGEWADGGDVPLGETSESYSIDILDGSEVVRTLTATSETVAYSAALQTTDFGSTQSSIDIEVFQISSVVGRGFGTMATV